MNAKPLTPLILILFLLTTCEKKKTSDPFDSDCPKEIFTPVNFTAKQVDEIVQLTWDQPIKGSNISGFKLQRQVDNGSWSVLSAQDKTTLIYEDKNITGGKIHRYKLTADAGGNLSNTVETQISPLLTANISTSVVNSITSNSAIFGGNVISDGGTAIKERGIVYSTLENPTISDSKVTKGIGIGNFQVVVSGLKPGTSYFTRAYAINNKGTSYGNQVSFKTQEMVLPTIITNQTEATSCSTATSGGDVTSAGDYSVTARGVCWSTTQNPTTINNKTSNGSGDGNFTSSINGLKESTTYYIRAYATNSEAGTSYGEQYAITTPACPALTPPSLLSPSDGAILDNGCYNKEDPMEWKFDWKESEGANNYHLHVISSEYSIPVIDKQMMTSSFEKSDYEYTTSTTNWIWKVRAYINGQWTDWSEQRTFTVEPVNTDCQTVPDLTSNTISDITINSATGGGNITGDGGSSITARGVCWSTSQNPTISDNKSNDGTGIGSFKSSITNLTCNTRYYVRAYATNSKGTGYGGELNFETTYCVTTPTVTTLPADINNNTLTLKGRIDSDGNGIITQRGFRFGQNGELNSDLPIQTTDNPFTYSIDITGESGTYQYQAYAANSAGKTYGNTESFTLIPVTNDFYITNASVSPTTVAPGGTISITCDQNYSGNSSAELTSYVGYYLSTNNSWGSSDILLDKDSSGLFSEDASDTESATLTIPAGTAEGTYYILFVADYKKEYNEKDESNNVSYKSINVSNQITKPFSATEDSYVNSSVPTMTFGNSSVLVFGVNNNNTETNNSLIKFDFSSIPSGSSIKSAELKLFVSKVDKVVVTGIIIYPLWSDNWSESTVNWNNQPSDFTSLIIFERSIASTTQNNYWSFNVTTWVKDWIEKNQSKLGFLLKSSDNSIFLNSSENSNAPVLEITYE